jgi:hypothetical protein
MRLSSLNTVSVKNATMYGPRPKPIMLITNRNIADANALTWLGIISCMAVVLAPIGDATKNAGINNNANTILGLLIKGIKQLSNMAVAAISPTLMRPF